MLPARVAFAALAAILLVWTAQAHDRSAEKKQGNPWGGRPPKRGCGAPEVTAADINAAVEAEKKVYGKPLADFADSQELRNAVTASTFNNRTLRVVFHVVHDGSQSATSDQFNQQLAILNTDFRQVGLQFQLVGWRVHNNPTWAANCGTQSGAEDRLFPYAVNRTTNIQMVFCLMTNGLLGFVTNFPSTTLSRNDKNTVYITTDSLPNGYYPYDMGRTATHELGHYFGVYHTFDLGCSKSDSDLVVDTPNQSGPKYGCPPEQDTCTNKRFSTHTGKDPYQNIMDYIDDRCMLRLTPGQSARAQAMLVSLRPSIYNAGLSGFGYGPGLVLEAGKNVLELPTSLNL